VAKKNGITNEKIKRESKYSRYNMPKWKEDKLVNQYE